MYKFEVGAMTSSLNQILSLATNVIQFVFAIIILGLAGASAASNEGTQSDINFVIFASVVTLIASALLAYLVFSPPKHKRWIISLLVLQFVLMIFWAAIVGNLVQQDGKPGTTGRLAVVELVFWLLPLIWGSLMFCRKGRREEKNPEGDFGIVV